MTKPPYLTQWVRVQDALPRESQRVVAIYAGVYGPRVVTFWRDTGGAAHFGLPNEPDGKGSQPTSHWLPLPKLPKN